jgi:hypothetical protein
MPSVNRQNSNHETEQHQRSEMIVLECLNDRYYLTAEHEAAHPLAPFVLGAAWAACFARLQRSPTGVYLNWFNELLSLR